MRVGTDASIVATMRSITAGVCRTIGSAACAQQRHVTHIGGHLPSSWPEASARTQGSDATSADAPDALNTSSATTIARSHRGTRRV
jgi:hypothetical protein